jgi:hypothetical protein
MPRRVLASGLFRQIIADGVIDRGAFAEGRFACRQIFHKNAIRSNSHSI